MFIFVKKTLTSENYNKKAINIDNFQNCINLLF